MGKAKDCIEFDYVNIPIVLVGVYHPYRYNGYEDPPDQEEFEIEKVMVGGEDIYEILSSERIEELEEMALAKADFGQYWE